MNWNLLWLVMAGGAFGAAGRHLLGGWLLRHAGTGMPWGTLACNLIGSFAAGFLFSWLESRGPHAIYWRAFLIVGVLGAFTTYSALMLECLLYTRTARFAPLLGYLVATLAGGFFLVWAGARLGDLLRG